MTILINLRFHTGCMAGIFITGIFGNFYTEWGEFLTSRTGIPGSPVVTNVGRCLAMASMLVVLELQKLFLSSHVSVCLL